MHEVRQIVYETSTRCGLKKKEVFKSTRGIIQEVFLLMYLILKMIVILSKDFGFVTKLRCLMHTNIHNAITNYTRVQIKLLKLN